MFNNKKHVVLVPVPGFGHIIPLLELGKKLVKYHDVSLAITAHKVIEINQRELLSESVGIKIIPIEDGFRIEDYPNPCCNKTFNALFQCMIPAFKQFLADLPVKGDENGNRRAIKPVDVFIVDNFMTSIMSPCVEKGIPFYHFNSAAAAASSLFLSIDENYPTIPDDSEEPPKLIGLPGPNQQLDPYTESTKKLLLPVKYTFKLAAGVIANSVRELEGDTLEMLTKHPLMDGVRFFFVGPLIPEEKADKAMQQDEEKVLKWLNGKDEKSIVYVSFGSMGFPSPKEIYEIGTALLALGQPVIWSLPQVHHKHLPITIQDQVNTKAEFLVLEWAPQKLILKHPSTAIFLSHCGWNSSIEAMSAGVPVVGWPMFADQLINADFMMKHGTCQYFKGTGMKPERLISADEIRETLSEVIENGRYGDAAIALARKIESANKPGGSSYVDFQELIKFNV